MSSAGAAPEGQPDLPLKEVASEREPAVCCGPDLVGHRLVHSLGEEFAVHGAPSLIVWAKTCVFSMRHAQAAASAFGIDSVTGPWIVARMDNHVCAHRIELNVAITGEDVILGLREAGAESSLPKGAGATADPVHILHVALAQILH